MNVVEKLCLELCEQIFYTSSVTDKNILKYSVNLSEDKKSRVEVILVTKEDEYEFVLDLPEEEVYREIDSHLYHCPKCAEKNKYNLKHINIKGYAAMPIGKVDLEHLKVILKKLAEDHASCMEENNKEKKKYKVGIFSELEESQRPILDTVRKILDEEHSSTIDINTFLEGIKTLEKTFTNLVERSNENLYVHGNILQKKLFVKNNGKNTQDYKIVNIKTQKNFPLVYDMLLTIFTFTDQQMRQHHFCELLDYYYNCLEQNLNTLCMDIKKSLSLTTFSIEVEKFLPHVKLDILKQLCQAFAKTATSINNQQNTEWCKNILYSIQEVNECILYQKLSRENCYTIVHNKIGSSDYNFLNYKLIPLDEREGFLGDYFKLKIVINFSGEEKLLQFFAKYLPTYSELAIDLALSSFKKEEFYYLQLIPTLKEMGLEDVVDFLPTCYFSRKDDVLIFDDLSAENYKTFPVSTPYTEEMLSMTIKKLAKIHASSLLYEELMTDKTKEVTRFDIKYPEYVAETILITTEESNIKKCYDCAFKTYLNMLYQFPDIPQKFSVEEFRKRAQLVLNTVYEKSKTSNKFRNVLCQGDCWAGNILFKCNENNGLTDCYIVDYQTTRYCPPAHDIYYFLYMSTSKEIRRKMESKLLQEYYSELLSILQKHNVDLNEIYTYQEFLECCHYMKSQALSQAICVLQFVLFPKEKMKVILQDNERAMNFFSVNRDILVEELQYDGQYSQRMKDIAEDLYVICENEIFM